MSRFLNDSLRHSATPDWAVLAGLTEVGAIAATAAPLLESETFASSTTYDGLNRPVRLRTPDNSEIRPSYNEANLLEQVQVRLRQSETWTPFVKDIDYDAKGQRTLIEYGNGVQTEYFYDEKTFRLMRLRTARVETKGNPLQDLAYTYDPVGNITEIRDGAQQTIFFNNTVVAASAYYEYDALYRLTQAFGREHIGQTTTVPEGNSAQPEYDAQDYPRVRLPHPNDGQAMRRYTQHYDYDAVGNILQMLHEAEGTTQWSRDYDYATDSNRLLRTSLPQAAWATYAYDIHGSMTKMPHLMQMDWDFKDQLQRVDLGGRGTAYYVYDAGGQRVRKVHEHNGATVEERIYLGGFEVYRQRNNSGLLLERETLHIMDDKRRIALVETKTFERIDVMDNSAAAAPVIRYQLDNHLGSTSLELDVEGAIISYEEYYPYGNTSYQAGRSVAETSLKRYRYTGKERDEETGLYYHGARYYASWLGRWTAADPAAIVDGFNLFVYTHNSPIGSIDPNGNETASFSAPPGLVFDTEQNKLIATPTPPQTEKKQKPKSESLNTVVRREILDRVKPGADQFNAGVEAIQLLEIGISLHSPKHENRSDVLIRSSDGGGSVIRNVTASEAEQIERRNDLIREEQIRQQAKDVLFGLLMSLSRITQGKQQFQSAVQLVGNNDSREVPTLLSLQNREIPK